jgi:hypothetical protein
MSGVNVPSHYYTEFARNIELLLQQRNSRFASSTMTGNHSGEKASPVDQVGANDMDDITTRFEPITRKDLPADRRWVFPISSDWSTQLDTFDALKLLTDPKSKYVEAGVAASNRRKDGHVITGFFADALTGVNAGTTETFGTGLTTDATPGQNVGVGVGGSASGMNVAKLKEALRRLEADEVDAEEEALFCALTATQRDNMLNEIQVISMDFNNSPVLVDGKLKRWLGFDFIKSNRLQTGTDNAAGTSRMIPVWAKSGMYYGNWQALVTDISQRKDLKGLPWQAYLMLTGGATRIEKKKIVRIWCRE